MTYTPATRYFQPGTTKLFFATQYDTMAHIAAGSDVSADVAAVNGFTTTEAALPTPNLASRFQGSIGGRLSADGSSIDFYADANGADIRAVLTLGQNTNAIWLANGTTTGGEMDVYPVRVGSIGLVRDLESVPLVRVMFDVTSQPTEQSTYPAS